MTISIEKIEEKIYEADRKATELFDTVKVIQFSPEVFRILNENIQKKMRYMQPLDIKSGVIEWAGANGRFSITCSSYIQDHQMLLFTEREGAAIVIVGDPPPKARFPIAFVDDKFPEVSEPPEAENKKFQKALKSL